MLKCNRLRRHLHHNNICFYDSKAVFREGIMELRVGSKYRLGRKIGSGSFGDIYLGKNIIDNCILI